MFIILLYRNPLLLILKPHVMLLAFFIFALPAFRAEPHFSPDASAALASRIYYIFTAFLTVIIWKFSSYASVLHSRLEAPKPSPFISNRKKYMWTAVKLSKLCFFRPSHPCPYKCAGLVFYFNFAKLVYYFKHSFPFACLGF